MEVKILGPGCPRCKRLEQLTHEAAQEAGIEEATFVKVSKMAEILAYPITATPGLVIDGAVKSSGRIPRKEEIIAWMKEARQ